MLTRTAALLALSGCDFIFTLKDPGIVDASIDAPSLECPTGYVANDTGTGIYRVERVAASWNAAEQRCRGDRADVAGSTHLVVIPDVVEFDVVAKLAAGQSIWVGLSDIAVESTFRWVSDEPSSFAAQPMVFPWGPIEPNNGAGGNQEDCVMLRDDGTFNDASCVVMLGFVCECDTHDAVPPVP